MSGTLSDTEIAQATALLGKLEPGFLPKTIFWQVARLTVTPTLELLPIWNDNGRLKVFLTQRPVDDPHWPSQWHIPGTVIRATDEPHSFATGFARVLHDELGDSFSVLKGPIEVGREFWDVTRGRELDALHYIQVTPKQGAHLAQFGEFFTLDALPADLMEHHKVLVPKIAHKAEV